MPLHVEKQHGLRDWGFGLSPPAEPAYTLNPKPYTVNPLSSAQTGPLGVDLPWCLHVKLVSW